MYKKYSHTYSTYLANRLSNYKHDTCTPSNKKHYIYLLHRNEYLSQMRLRLLILFVLLFPLRGMAQSDPHFTQFMYNKLLYNPGYAGSRDVTGMSAQYRSQWAGIDGAPRTLNFSVDGQVGSYMNPFRKVALGLTATSEQIGVENNQLLRGYFAYRIKFEKSVLSLGLSGGGDNYTARYSDLFPQNSIDPNLNHNILHRFLPNFGMGGYWSSEKFYVGVSAPSLIENHYDVYGTKLARQIRAWYLSGGYVYAVNDIVQLKPQAIIRYAANGSYKLPVSCDINLTGIFYNRLMCGMSYRTDKSIAAIVQLQVSNKFNLGYSYDYLMSDLSPYAKGAHEFVLYYEFRRNVMNFATPRFSKSF